MVPRKRNKAAKNGVPPFNKDLGPTAKPDNRILIPNGLRGQVEKDEEGRAKRNSPLRMAYNFETKPAILAAVT